MALALAILYVGVPGCDDKEPPPHLSPQMVAELDRSGTQLDLLDDTDAGRDEDARRKVATKIDLRDGATIEGVSLATVTDDREMRGRQWVVWVDHVRADCYGVGCPAEPAYGRGVYFLDAQSLKSEWSMIF